METIPRKIISEITSDIATGPIPPDLLTITRILEGKPSGQALDIRKQIEAKPGRYLLLGKKVGYDDLEEEIIIYPSDQPYVVKREMKARRVPLIIKTDTDYDPGVPARPDEIKLDGEVGDSGQKMKPGNYTLMLRKDGYHIIEKRIKIEPSNDDFIVKEQFKAKPRQLVYDIKGGDALEKIVDPGSVTFDRNLVKENADIPPKKQGYEVRIKKDGFGLWKQNLIVEPSDKAFILKAILNVLKRRIVLTVEASYPHGHNLMPVDKCLLGDVVIHDDTEVKPGDYQLVVNKTAYRPVARPEKIPPGEQAHRIHVVMDPAPRTVDLDIQYDVAPENPKSNKVSASSVAVSIKTSKTAIASSQTNTICKSSPMAMKTWKKKSRYRRPKAPIP